jgi:hypothetical protein
MTFERNIIAVLRLQLLSLFDILKLLSFDILYLNLKLLKLNLKKIRKLNQLLMIFPIEHQTEFNWHSFLGVH